MLWEISGNGLSSPSYLFGTIHVKDQRAFQFNDSVMVKLNQCDAFAPEIVLTPELEQQLGASILLEGTTLKELYSAEDYEFIAKIINESMGMDITLFNGIKPMALSVMVMETRMDQSMPHTLDKYLENEAREANKEILSVEKLEDQLKLFDMVDADAVLDYFKKLEEYDDFTESMIRLYEAEDVEGLVELIYSDSTWLSMMNVMLRDRNYTMTESIDKMIQGRTTFVAIGSGHLGGAEGVVKLLRKKGYQVEAVLAAKTQKMEKPEEPTIAVKAPTDWYSLDTENSEFSLLMPAEPTLQNQQVDSEIGKLDMTIHMYQPTADMEDQNVIYGLIYTDYPEGTVHSENEEMLKEVFDGAMNGAAKNVNGTLSNEKDLTINGYPGKEFDINMAGGLMLLRLRSYLVNNRMYILQTACEAGNKGNERSIQFFESFKLK